jgi:glycosyltransferase involved in cell wall biosynthesis
MRIAEINDVASVASELTRGLRARGHDVTLLQPSLVGGGLPPGIKAVVAPIRALDWARVLWRLKRGRFDLLHIHYAYLGMLGVLAKAPYILHCHGADVWALTPFTRGVTGRALRQAGHVYYSTPDLAPHVLPLRPDAEFLPNPIDTHTFRPLQPARDSKRVYVCCALDDLKGAQHILAACRDLAETRPDIQVTAVAGGQHTAAFEALPNVTLIPRQQRANLPEVIGRHGVVVGQVSLGAAGMAELEAMACARPVVCLFTFDAAYPEPPPFVRAQEGDEIAAAVIRMVDDPELRQRTGEQGRAWIERYHDLDAVAERVERAALDVLAARKDPSCGHAS